MNYFFMLKLSSHGKHPGIIFNKTWIIKLWLTLGDGLKKEKHHHHNNVAHDGDVLTLCWFFILFLVKMLSSGVFSCVVTLNLHAQWGDPHSWSDQCRDRYYICWWRFSRRGGRRSECLKFKETSFLDYTLPMGRMSGTVTLFYAIYKECIVI